MEYKPCQYHYENNPNKKCPHPALPGKDYCIFHIRQNRKEWKNLKKYIEQYRRQYPGEPPDLEEAYLVDANLREADLSGINLQRANLTNANLSGANLENAMLDDADLSNANLSNANLLDASLIGTNLSGAQLSSAVLINADLSEGILRDSKLNSADLTGARLENAILDNANLRDAILRDALLSYSSLKNADLQNADLSDCNLTMVNASYSNFAGAHMIRTVLTSATLEYCTLDKVFFKNVIAQGCSFNFSRIRESYLYSSDFSDSSFVSTEFIGSKSEFSDFSRVDFSDSTLSNSIFYETIVEDAKFYGTNFELTDFSGTDLSKAKVDIATTLSSKYVFWDPSQVIPLNEEQHGERYLKDNNYSEALKEFDRARMIYSQIKEYYRQRGYYNLMDTYFVRENIVLEKIYTLLASKLLRDPTNVYNIAHNDNSHIAHLIRTYLTPSFLMSRITNKEILNKLLQNKPVFLIASFVYSLWQWLWRKFIRLTSNYGTSIGRIFAWFFVIIIGFSFLYHYLGIPGYYNSEGELIVIKNWQDDIYFSVVTFTTLGYGDYAPHEYKLIAASEALLGAFFISYFVVVVIRKILR